MFEKSARSTILVLISSSYFADVDPFLAHNYSAHFYKYTSHLSELSDVCNLFYVYFLPQGIEKIIVQNMSPVSKLSIFHNLSYSLPSTLVAMPV